MKYFWYMLRVKYRDARHSAGFYDAYMGRRSDSKNCDYMRGYKLAVANVQLIAGMEERLTQQFRKSEEHVKEAHEHMELVKRAVAENL